MITAYNHHFREGKVAADPLSGDNDKSPARHRAVRSRIAWENAHHRS